METLAENLVWEALQKAFPKDEAAIYRDYKLSTPESSVREIDFLVIHRSLGILVIEVKAYKLEDIRETDDSGWFIQNQSRSNLRSNPLEQAKNGVYGAKEVVRKRLHDISIMFTALVALPNISRQAWQQYHRDGSQILFKEDLSSRNLIEKLTQLVRTQSSSRISGERELTDEEWRKLRTVFEPEYIVKYVAETSTSTRRPNPSRKSKIAIAENQGIFISYRRDDSAWPSGRIYATLEPVFPEKIFWDTATIKPGEDWIDAIDSALERSLVLIAVIGKLWTTVTKTDGTRRLDDPDDKLVQEIKVALDKGVTVIPILIDDTPMPKESELPTSICSLHRKQALQISPDNFEYKIGLLVDRINELVTIAAK